MSRYNKYVYTFKNTFKRKAGQISSIKYKVYSISLSFSEIK